MYSKIINPAKHGNITYNNKSSAARLGNYLGKELKNEEKINIFFNSEGDFDKKQMLESIDNNVKGLGIKDDKFHSLVIAPSAKELEHIGNDTQKMKAFTIACMEKYAVNFNLSTRKKLSEKDLVWFATIHQNRAFKGTDVEVLNGTKKSGELKEGLQTHIHVVVSARDKEMKITLNPNTSNKNRFKMTDWFEANQKQFNLQFDFKPEPRIARPQKDKTAYFILWTEKKLEQLEKLGITDKQISEIRNIAKDKNNSQDFRQNLSKIIKDLKAQNPSKNITQKDVFISTKQIKSLENSTVFRKQEDLELPVSSKSFVADFHSFRHILESISSQDNPTTPNRKRKKALSKNSVDQDISM